jgi:hypothetical protein
VDAWLGLWADPDAASRSRTLARLASPDVQFHDRFSALEGIDEVDAHVTAAQRFMPGLSLQRRGSIRHCQGVVLAGLGSHRVRWRFTRHRDERVSSRPGRADRVGDGLLDRAVIFLCWTDAPHVVESM